MKRPIASFVDGAYNAQVSRSIELSAGSPDKVFRPREDARLGIFSRSLLIVT